MRTILVTGGTGFLGSNLCHRLISMGERVLCMDNNYTGRMANIETLMTHPNFTFIHHDVCDPIVIPDEHIDQIYNLACPASPVSYQGKYSIKTTKTCVLGALNVLELAKLHNATVLQTSTSEIYGEPLIHPQPETYWGNVNPNGIRSCYDEGKRCAESLFLDYHRHCGVDVKIVRIFNVYGPNMDPNDGRVISNFICQALSNQPITVYGNGTQTRSLCYVDDLIDGLIRMMNSDAGFTGPVNLGNPNERSINELADMIAKKLGHCTNIVNKPLPCDDPTRRRPDISLAKNVLGWEPTTDIETGLDKTIEYFKTQIHLFK